MSRALKNAEVTLYYHLPDLPTVQHKAGLAGLLLLIESMLQRGLGPLPAVHDLTATSAMLTFSREAMQAIFDDLYDAKVVETPLKTKRKDKDLKREEIVEVTDPEMGKVKRSKRFIVPKAAFLEYLYPGDEEGWLKLWRDMLWSPYVDDQPLASSMKNEQRTNRVGKPKMPGRHFSSSLKELRKVSSLSPRPPVLCLLGHRQAMPKGFLS